MRIAVFGAGSVGGYFGARLAGTNHEVFFIARGEHLRAIQERGLRVDSPNGDIVLFSVQATNDTHQVGVVDLVLLAVKAWQVDEIGEQLRPLIGPTTSIIPLLNGVDAPKQLSVMVGQPAILGGMCQISAYIEAPGYIRHVGIEPLIAFGELDGSFSKRITLLKEVFEQASIRVETPLSIISAMWRKFLFIASLSGVGSLTRSPVGVIRSLGETRQMLESAMREIEVLARQRGVDLDPDVVTKTLIFIDRMEPGVVTSMQRDILEGRPSELEAQNGAVVRMGKESGVPTPIHALIYASLLPQEHRARGQVSF